jgi:serine/threonine protein kinase
MSDFKIYKECYQTNENNEPSKGGGQGTTFKVQNKSSKLDSPTYILKLLKQQNDLERRTRMRREFTSLQTLKVNGIPSTIESNTEFYDKLEYKLFIVMEYIPGITVAEFVKALTDNTLEISFLEIAAFFNKLLDIINSCHQINIIHRDLKPDNIILKNNDIENPFLVDFGQSFNELETTLITPDFQIMGNRFLYLPELSKNSLNKRDYRSDITMAIAILYYILTGKEPGHLIDEANQLPHQRGLYSRYLCEVNPEITKYIDRIFDKGFQQNINYRFQSIDSLKEEFKNAINAPLMNQDLKNKLAEFNRERQTESKKSLLAMSDKLEKLFSYLNSLSLNLIQTSFNNNLTRAAGKYIKNLPESIGGTTFTYIDKTDAKKSVSFKIIGQIIGNEIIFIGEIINHALDDNVILVNGDTIYRINVNDNFELAKSNIENYIIEKTIERIS